MILQLLVALVIIGCALAILQLIPIDATIKRVIYIIVIAIVCIWAIKILLPMSGLG